MLDEDKSDEKEGQMMAPDPPIRRRGVSNNQLAKGASKAGGGWQESIDGHTTTMVGNNEQGEHEADDEGSNEEGEGGKGNGE